MIKVLVASYIAPFAYKVKVSLSIIECYGILSFQLLIDIIEALHVSFKINICWKCIVDEIDHAIIEQPDFTSKYTDATLTIQPQQV